MDGQEAIHDVYSNRVTRMMEAQYDESKNDGVPLGLTLFKNVCGLFVIGEERLSEMGAEKIALEDCNETEKHVEREVTEKFMVALAWDLTHEYLSILEEMVKISRRMLTQASTLEELGSVINWMSTLAIRALGFTMERRDRRASDGDGCWHPLNINSPWHPSTNLAGVLVISGMAYASAG